MRIEYTHLYKILSEVSRRRIVAVLDGVECSVQDLQDVLSLGQSSISAHLALLRTNKLVDSRRKGRFVLYRLALGQNVEIDSFLTTILELLRKEGWYDRDHKNFDRLIKEKSELSLSFYEGVETQNKRSPGQTDHGLAIGLLRTIRDQVIVDIGCGSGKLARELAKYNKKVVGLDADKKQIAIAKKMSGDINKKKLVFLERKGENTKQTDASINTVLFSHSLHHIQEPNLAIKETSRILKKKGVIIILDLKKHEEHWMKKIYGDIHLGFDIDEIEQWLIDEGFIDLSIDVYTGDDEFPHFETLVITAIKA